VNSEQLTLKLRQLSDDCEIQVIDLTGTENHYAVYITSKIFARKNMVEQHRLVYALISKELNTAEIHAVNLTTSLPN